MLESIEYITNLAADIMDEAATLRMLLMQTQQRIADLESQVLTDNKRE